MKSHARALAVVGCTLLALTISACSTGSDSSPDRETAGDVSATPRAELTGTPPAGAKIIKITLDGKTVEPSALRLSVDLKQPVVLQIHASSAGQLHVHSTPEQKIDFPAGDSEFTLVIAEPGIVDVEDHALDKLIAQLEVS